MGDTSTLHDTGTCLCGENPVAPPALFSASLSDPGLGMPPTWDRCHGGHQAGGWGRYLMEMMASMACCCTIMPWGPAGSSRSSTWGAQQRGTAQDGAVSFAQQEPVGLAEPRCPHPGTPSPPSTQWSQAPWLEGLCPSQSHRLAKGPANIQPGHPGGFGASPRMETSSSAHPQPPCLAKLSSAPGAVSLPAAPAPASA